MYLVFIVSFLSAHLRIEVLICQPVKIEKASTAGERRDINHRALRTAVEAVGRYYWGCRFYADLLLTTSYVPSG